MRMLALLTLAAGRTRADAQPHVRAEERALWSMYKDGLLRDRYFHPDPLTVSLMFEADGAAEVEAALDTLPMVQAGLLDTQIVTLGPWVSVEALFDPALRSDA